MQSDFLKWNWKHKQGYKHKRQKYKIMSICSTPFPQNDNIGRVMIM